MTGLIAAGVSALGLPAHAQVSGGATLSQQVRLPNAEYTETTTDLRVKVLGGEIRINRTWTNGRWYLNPTWASLRFINDPLDESVKTIDRAGSLFIRSGDSDLYIFEQVYIRKTDTGWRWYDRNGNWITYNPHGHMTGYGDANRTIATFELDQRGNPAVIKNQQGQTIYTIAYDSRGNFTQVSDTQNRSVTYQWDQGKLLTVTDLLGNQWRYAYDSQGQINQRTEPDGGVVRIGYIYSPPSKNHTLYKRGYIQNTPGGLATRAGIRLPSAQALKKLRQRDVQLARVGTITDKTAAVTLYNTDYNRTNKQFTITIDNPLGVQTTLRYNSEGKITSRAVNGEVQRTIERDGDTKTTTINERGQRTTVIYDSARNPLHITRADGAIETYAYDNNLNKPIRHTDALGNTSAWAYDSAGNPTRMTQAQGKPEERSATWTYNSQALPATVTVGEGEQAITLHYTYDANGNLNTVTDADALGNTYTLSHNIQGQVTSVTNPLGNIWTMQYNTAGYPQSTTDPLGNTLRYTTDAFGRITQSTDALGHTHSYAYEYNNTGDNNVQGWKVTQTNALGQSVVYQYDAVGNLVSTLTPAGEVITYSYDATGRLQSQTDAAGNTVTLQYGTQGSGLEGLIASTLYPTYQENYAYNALGLPTQVIQILSEQQSLTTRIGYDANGQTISVTDAAGRTTQTVYDALGNIIKQIDAMGNLTLQTWDIMGNLTSVTDPLGNTHTFEYNANGNLTSETTPLGQTTSYAYDAANQLIQTIDPDGNTTAYTYDAAGRLTHETYTAKGNNPQATPDKTIRYVYNAAGQIIEVAQTSVQANTAEQAAGTTTISTWHVYTLDALGRKTQEVITYTTHNTAGGNRAGTTTLSQTLKYSYNADGQLASITYPGGYTQSYTYEHGQLKSVRLPNGQTMTWNGYIWQRPAEIILPGSTQILTYDALQRTRGIETRSTNAVNGDHATLLSMLYTYDAAGNIVQRQTTDGLFTYAYDQLDRLTQAEPPQTLQQAGLPIEAYAYDAAGNRIGSAQQPGNWQYNADNQLITYGSNEQQTRYTYTNNGNVATQTTNGVTLAYHYDAANRLVRITNETAQTEIASYAYDAMGRRISKTVNGETTYYLYANEGLIAELDDAGHIKVAYGWQPGSLYGTSPLWQANTATNSSNLQTAQYHFITTDHLGTPQMATDQSGVVTWKAATQVFGRTIPSQDNLITMNLRFPGQYFDQETATHYNYYRDYNPQTGRYIQRDPIGLNGGINVYGYVKGNALRYVDSLGLETCILVTRGESSPTGFGNHAALYGSYSADGAWIFDPPGSFSQTIQMTSHGDDWTVTASDICQTEEQISTTEKYCELAKADLINAFASFHRPEYVELICSSTTPEQEQRLYEGALRRDHEIFGGQCSSYVSDVLQEVFPDYSGTMWPGWQDFPRNMNPYRQIIRVE